MSEQEQTYKLGDWVVHLVYGMGQVKKIEEKPIGGTQKNVTTCAPMTVFSGYHWITQITNAFVPSPAQNGYNAPLMP